jgi:hypothetical protein
MWSAIGRHLAALHKHMAEKDFVGDAAESVRENHLAYTINSACKIGSGSDGGTGKVDAGSG